MIDIDELRRRLDYDPLAGVFLWKEPHGGTARVGGLAGVKNSTGYWYISFGKKRCLAHRLAWAMVTGTWPETSIDHIDRNRSNNTFSNLRLATISQNAANSPKRSGNTSGFKGVSFFKPHGLWRARITVNYREVHIGYFDTPEAASAAYEIKAKEMFGEFAIAA